MRTARLIPFLGLSAALVGGATVPPAAVATPAAAAAPVGPAAINTCPAAKSTVQRTVPATQAKNVAITFDDGPSPKWTPQILDILKRNNVKATFFVIGDNARAHPAILKRIYAEGHFIGNHTQTHPNMKDLSASAQASQLDQGTRSISVALGGSYKPCYFRPPYGSYNTTTFNAAKQRGMSFIMWSHDTNDWRTPGSVSSSFQNSIVSQGTIPAGHHPNVLMHDSSQIPGSFRQNTVDSVQRIVTYYRSRGYSFTDPVGAPSRSPHLAPSPVSRPSGCRHP